jgi:hypothetical protein
VGAKQLVDTRWLSFFVSSALRELRPVWGLPVWLGSLWVLVVSDLFFENCIASTSIFIWAWLVLTVLPFCIQLSGCLFGVGFG